MGYSEMMYERMQDAIAAQDAAEMGEHKALVRVGHLEDLCRDLFAEVTRCSDPETIGRFLARMDFLGVEP